jgi:hypothetical protein
MKQLDAPQIYDSMKKKQININKISHFNLNTTFCYSRNDIVCGKKKNDIV